MLVICIALPKKYDNETNLGQDFTSDASGKKTIVLLRVLH